MSVLPTRLELRVLMPAAQAGGASPALVLAPVRGRRADSDSGDFLSAFMKNNVGGVSKQKGGQVSASVGLGNDWRASAALQFRPSRYDDRELAGAASVQRSSAAGFEAGVSSDPGSAVSLKLSGQAQRITGGHNLNAEAVLSWRALPQWQVDVVPGAYYTTGEPRYLGWGETPGDYLFGQLTARGMGAAVRSTAKVLPRLSMLASARLLMTVGDYDSTSVFQANPNSRWQNIELRRLAPSSEPPQANPDFEQAVWNLDLAVRWEIVREASFYFEYLRGQAPNYQQLPMQPADAHQGSLRRVPAADVFLLKLHCAWK
ncbi:MAG: hypothetical protein HY898_30730 [Deltaproteobacteria bacterium]|nr:hypothetical protein [Deltaproteobacteria bacterium]